LEVGFADVSTFTQAFRQHFNTTPGRIRNLHDIDAEQQSDIDL
ncbi:MAG: AraC family transcriptional regulator, partial [Gemmatimonadaceae bacterium]|nr:AraC family transcriptional regulator [Chitinophagaceae bacterium]